MRRKPKALVQYTKRRRDRTLRQLFYQISEGGARHGRSRLGATVDFTDWLNHILEGPFYLRITEAQ